MIFTRCLIGPFDDDDEGDDATVDDTPEVTEAVDGLLGSHFNTPPPPVAIMSLVDTPLSLESSLS